MIRRPWGVLMVTCWVFAYLVGCASSPQVPLVTELQLAKDLNGQAPAAGFEPDETVYALVTLTGISEGTAIRALWSVVDIGDVAPAGALVDEVERPALDGSLYFSLAPDSPFPPGRYKIDVYLDDQIAATREFVVAGDVFRVAQTDTRSVETPGPPVEPLPQATDTPSPLVPLRRATVRIVAEGTWLEADGTAHVDPQAGAGFIIDPSGLAVTNHHLVAGASRLQVFLPGESEPQDAEVVAVSECADLAVIDIEGDGYSSLAWYDGDLQAGQAVYAAAVSSLPGGDVEIGQGLILEAEAGGDNERVSLARLLQVETALDSIFPGGPLTGDQGEVLGVVLTVAADTGQAVAIASSEALPVVEQLRQAHDGTGIGLNGRALAPGSGPAGGVWVAAVVPGSRAEAAGIRAGDLIFLLDNEALATDGTLAAYCDILRAAGPDEMLELAVYRPASQEVLVGEVNGDPLAVTSSIDLADGFDTGPSYRQFVQVSDDTGALTVEVPREWADIDGRGWIANNETPLGPGLVAAPSIDGFENSWTTPGLFFAVSEDNIMRNDPVALLDTYSLDASCTYDRRGRYRDLRYEGSYDVWTDCGEQGTSYVILTAAPPNNEHLILLQVQIASAADEEALQRILRTFAFNPNAPG